MKGRPRISKAGLRQADAYELFLGLHIRHVDNEFYGEPFLLEPWQRDDMWRPLFGTGRMERGRFVRRFRRVLFGLPRDGGKTEIAAAILLTIASMEPVHQGEYGVLASSRTQAGKAFRKMKSMILQDPDLSAMWEVLTDTIVHRETGARIIVLPYSEAATQSYHFNVCIIDEYHVHRTSAVLEAVVSGQKAIHNALCVVITTAGDKRRGPLWDLLKQWADDPAAYVYWLGAADEDRIDDPAVWAKVTPMSWVTLADVEDQYRSTSRRSFERYTLNRFPIEQGRGQFFAPRDLRAADVSPDISATRPSYITIDGADKSDHFAVTLSQMDDDGVLHAMSWVFDDPGERGYYDLNLIEETIVHIHDTYNVERIAIDAARIRMLAIRLQDVYGMAVEEFPQTNKMMCPASAALRELVRSRRLRVGGQPRVMRHLENAVEIHREPFGTRIGKAEDDAKIDSAITLAMAAFLWSVRAEATPSLVEGGGIWTL